MLMDQLRARLLSQSHLRSVQVRAQVQASLLRAALAAWARALDRTRRRRRRIRL
jgi:hypothetical protein